MQSTSILLGALLSREQNRLQYVLKDTVAYSRFTQFEGSEFQMVGPPTEGPPTHLDTAEQSSGAGWLIVDVD